MEQINLSTHGRDIQRAYEQVVRGDGDATWVIYGPDSSKAYKVAETGTDFDEFLDSFNESQIQFGLARVNPPGSDVQKNLLVGWCPDSAPLKPRSSFAQNFAEVSKLLKGYHVQITARDSDDLDKNELLSRLSSAAGARYSIQASRSNASSTTASASSYKPTPVSRPIAPKPTPKPVVSKPVPSPVPAPAPKPVAKPEPKIIKPAAKSDDDWNEPEVEERDFSKNPLKPNTSSWKPIGRVNLQDVIKEEKARPDPRLEIQQLKQKEKLSRDQEIDDYLKAKPASFGSKAPAPVSTFGNSADKLVGGISKSFGSQNGKTPAQLWAEKKSAGSVPAKAEETEAEEEQGEEEQAEEEEQPEEQEDVADLKKKFDQLDVEAEEEEEDSKVLPKGHSFPPPPQRVVKPAPEPEHEEEEEEEEPEQEEEEEEGPAPSLPSRSAVPPPPARPVETEQEEEEEEQEIIVAIAEYDYDASEDNELTFAEGQRIFNIEFIDEDWWLGQLENGDKGLFPSNYVSLEQ